MKESTSFSPPLQLSHRWRHRCATRRRLRCSTCGLRFCKRPSDFQPIVNKSITSGSPSKHVNLFCTIDLELNYISTQRRDGAVLCKCPQTVLRTPPPVTLTPTRPHPRSPPNPNQLPPAPSRLLLAGVPTATLSPSALLLARIGWSAALHSSQRPAMELRGGARSAEIRRQDARWSRTRGGRSRCGSTSTVPMEDSGGRRGTGSGATL
jgi:hypothetical protein